MITYKIHHVNGLYFELTGDSDKNREYDISFFDNQTKTNIYECKLKVGAWSRLDRKYLSDISIIIRFDGRTIKQINFLDEIKGKRVFITFESKALGDTLAWIPYCDEFSKKYECKVLVSTFKNFLFEKVYPNLEFVDRGVKVENIIGMFDCLSENYEISYMDRLVQICAPTMSPIYVQLVEKEEDLGVNKDCSRFNNLPARYTNSLSCSELT
jgi:hypothetical protein